MELLTPIWKYIDTIALNIDVFSDRDIYAEILEHQR